MVQDKDWEQDWEKDDSHTEGWEEEKSGYDFI